MTSKPGEPDTGFAGTSGLGAGAAAFEEQQKQEQQNQQAIAADPTPATGTETTEKKDEPVEKKLEDLTLGDKKEEPASQEGKKAEDVAAPAPAATQAPTATIPAPEKTTTGEPVWPETDAEHPLTKFFEAIGTLTEEASHNEVWGITLSSSNAFLTKLILQKFLRANANDLTKAKEQLLDTLKWRKQFDPVAAASATYDKDKFDGLGYILEVEGVPESLNKKDIVTFNVYGAVKDNQKTFGDLDAYVKEISCLLL